MSLISSFTIECSDTVHTHSHPHAHLILPVQKNFFIQFGGRSREVTPRQFAFVPPGVSHAYRCQGLSITLNIPAEMVKSVALALLTAPPEPGPAPPPRQLRRTGQRCGAGGH